MLRRTSYGVLDEVWFCLWAIKHVVGGPTSPVNLVGGLFFDDEFLQSRGLLGCADCVAFEAGKVPVGRLLKPNITGYWVMSQVT